MEPIVQLNSNAKLSEHFLLGEFTKSGSHPNIYNVPTHEAIANLKHLCQWLEVLLRGDIAGLCRRIAAGVRRTAGGKKQIWSHLAAFCSAF